MLEKDFQAEMLSHHGSRFLGKIPKILKLKTLWLLAIIRKLTCSLIGSKVHEKARETTNYN